MRVRFRIHNLDFETISYESFIRRLRLKAHHFCKYNGQNNSRQFDNFGFKTSVTPPQNEYLNAFENDMYEMIRNIEFINVRNRFQDKLKQDLQNIQSSKNILAFADKSQTYMSYPRKVMRSFCMKISPKHIKKHL